MKRFLLAVAVIGLVACSQEESSSVAPSGQVAAGSGGLASCTACHGAQGQGNKGMLAPGLANLEAEYIERQLGNFKNGIRGAAQGDSSGAQMAAIAAGLDDAAIASMAAAASGLDDYTPAATVDGNAENGKDLYYHQCGACHGPAAKGNALLQAPKLAGLEDWYVLAQLEKFANGQRGSHSADKLGGQMATMMEKLKGKDFSDIAAYLRAPIDAE